MNLGSVLVAACRDGSGRDTTVPGPTLCARLSEQGIDATARSRAFTDLAREDRFLTAKRRSFKPPCRVPGASLPWPLAELRVTLQALPQICGRRRSRFAVSASSCAAGPQGKVDYEGLGMSLRRSHLLWSDTLEEAFPHSFFGDKAKWRAGPIGLLLWFEPLRDTDGRLAVRGFEIRRLRSVTKQHT